MLEDFNHPETFPFCTYDKYKNIKCVKLNEAETFLTDGMGKPLFLYKGRKLFAEKYTILETGRMSVTQYTVLEWGVPDNIFKEESSSKFLNLALLRGLCK